MKDKIKYILVSLLIICIVVSMVLIKKYATFSNKNMSMYILDLLGVSIFLGLGLMIYKEKK